ncbi:MAG: OmpA family protein [Acidobacteriaceae bacterium]
MSTKQRMGKTRKPWGVWPGLLLSGAVALVAAQPLAAQTTTQVSSSTQVSRSTGAASIPSDVPSRVDIFAGYSYLYPFEGKIAGGSFKPLKKGVIGSFSYYFNHYMGAQLEGSYHFETPYERDGMYTLGAGPVFRLPLPHGVTPFVHAIGGASQVTGPNQPTIGGSSFFYNPSTWAPTALGGGGLDINLFTRRIALRLFQADYQYTHVDYGPLHPTSGGNTTIGALRGSAGLVFRLGVPEELGPIAYACLAKPAEVHSGDLVSVIGTVNNADPRKQLVYSWSTTGGQLTPRANSAVVDTTGLVAGNYTITGHVSEGRRRDESADCTTGFSIRLNQPPTITCAANPSTVNPGDMSTITAQGYSPQNRPLSYSYGTTAGTILGTGTTATLSTQGAQPGPITVSCNVVDDRGQSASAAAQVTVLAPPPQPRPSTQALCSITFLRDKRRPTRVDNEAKACLDEVALTLQRNPDAKVVIVGEASRYEPDRLSRAAQRAVNTKEYLTVSKGIDPSRIEVRTGPALGKRAQNYLLPSGADFDLDVSGSFPVAPSIKPQIRKPLAYRHRAKRPVVKK